MTEMYLSSNKGHRVGPGVTAIDPIAGSGITLNPSATTNQTQTVVGGAQYAVTIVGASAFIFSITGTIATAANIEWVCAPNETIVIVIPQSITTLNYGVLSASAGTNVAFVRRLS